MKEKSIMNADNADIEQQVANAMKSTTMNNCTITINIYNTPEIDSSHDNTEAHGGTVTQTNNQRGTK